MRDIVIGSIRLVKGVQYYLWCAIHPIRTTRMLLYMHSKKFRAWYRKRHW